VLYFHQGVPPRCSILNLHTALFLVAKRQIRRIAISNHTVWSSLGVYRRVIPPCLSMAVHYSGTVEPWLRIAMIWTSKHYLCASWRTWIIESLSHVRVSSPVKLLLSWNIRIGAVNLKATSGQGRPCFFASMSLSQWFFWGPCRLNRVPDR
jgi:hypothetical protein